MRTLKTFFPLLILLALLPTLALGSSHRDLFVMDLENDGIVLSGQVITDRLSPLAPHHVRWNSAQQPREHILLGSSVELAALGFLVTDEFGLPLTEDLFVIGGRLSVTDPGGGGGAAGNAWEFLQLLDTDGDGVLGPADPAWGALAEWLDEDDDGDWIEGSPEVQPLDLGPVQSIPISGGAAQADGFGNLHIGGQLIVSGGFLRNAASVLLAEIESAPAGGLDWLPVAGATVEINYPDQKFSALRVGNLGSSGCDGVSIAPGGGGGGGGECTCLVGYGFGIDENFFTTECSELEIEVEEIYEAGSSMGAAQYSGPCNASPGRGSGITGRGTVVTGRLGGVAVISVPVADGATWWESFAIPDGFRSDAMSHSPEDAQSPPGITHSFLWDSAADVTLGGTIVLIDEVEARFEYRQEFGPVRGTRGSMRMTNPVLPPREFMLDRIQTRALQHDMMGIGDALISPAPESMGCDGCLIISNIGSSGEDGVCILLDPLEDRSILKTFFETGDVPSSGDFIHTQGTERLLDGNSSVFVDVWERPVRAGMEVEIAFANGSTQQEVSFLLGGVVVHVRDAFGNLVFGHPDNRWPGARLVEGDPDRPLVGAGVRFDTPAPITFPNMSDPVFADEIWVRDVDGSPADLDALDIVILVEEGPGFGISAVNGRLRPGPSSDWAETESLGSATLHEVGGDLIVSNIGSSGLDGVRMSETCCLEAFPCKWKLSAASNQGHGVIALRILDPDSDGDTLGDATETGDGSGVLLSAANHIDPAQGVTWQLWLDGELLREVEALNDEPILVLPEHTGGATAHSGGGGGGAGGRLAIEYALDGDTPVTILGPVPETVIADRVQVLLGDGFAEALGAGIQLNITDFDFLRILSSGGDGVTATPVAPPALTMLRPPPPPPKNPPPTPQGGCEAGTGEAGDHRPARPHRRHARRRPDARGEPSGDLERDERRRPRGLLGRLPDAFDR